MIQLRQVEGQRVFRPRIVATQAFIPAVKLPFVIPLSTECTFRNRNRSLFATRLKQHCIRLLVVPFV